MTFFKKPVDLRTDAKQVKKSDQLERTLKHGLHNENGKVTEVFTWKFIFAILLLPVWLLWKLLEVIHLLTLIIFGGFLLYFGTIGLVKNAWSETALYFIIGIVLVVAPILYWLDKDK